MKGLYPCARRFAVSSTLLLAWGCPLAQVQPASVLAGPGDLARFAVKNFSVVGENPLTAELTRKTLAPFMGESVDMGHLEEAAQALRNQLRARGFAFHRVVLSPANNSGVIRLEVYGAALGKVDVQGNQIFADTNILNSLPRLIPGVSFDTRQLARDLAVANENPSKQTSVRFVPGAVSDTVDAAVDVIDARTVGGYISADNTGKGRITLGASHANLFDRDHQAAISVTGAPGQAGGLHQYGAIYRVPLYPKGGILSAFAMRSSINAGSVAQRLAVTGPGTFAGVQYDHYFAPQGDYRGILTVGLEDRHFEPARAATPGALPAGPDYRTRPLTVRYAGRVQPGWGQWGFNLDLVRNLALGSGNEAPRYAANRAGAPAHWSLARAGADVSVDLPDSWLLTGRVKLQASGVPLVPGEQFGVGGSQSVRGLDERVLSGDTGFQGSVEVLTPALAENTRLLAFYDRGQVRRHQDALLALATASSFGLGVRWNHGSALSAAVDFAHVLSGMDNLPAGTPRDKVHLRLNWRY